MNNYPIDNALDNAEGIFEIDLVNGLSGTTFPRVPVTGKNTFNQILSEYGHEIEIDIGESKVQFTNKRTGQQTNDRNETLESLGFENGDVLSVVDNCGVA